MMHRTRPHPPRAWAHTLLTLVLALSAGCQDPAPAHSPQRANAGVVDSTLPIAEEIRRFVVTVDSVPTRLREGARSRDELVARFLRAVESRDTLEFPRLHLQRDEFIGVYFPHTPFVAPPYELSPALLWFQMQNRSSRGIGRLLDRDGGRRLGATTVTCPDSAVHQERNRIWNGCTVTVRDSAGVSRVRQLFGGILERDGVWKFLSFSNDY